MKLSVLVATRNRARTIAPCLNSVAAAFANAEPIEAEIIVVDNASTDDTASVLKAWASASSIPVTLLYEPQKGKGRALNRALRAAQGEILAFTDDDCRLSKDYVNDLLRHDAADNELVLRGGRIELGDPADLPFTINTDPTLKRWQRRMNSARYECFRGRINGCNMTMRRALVERLGPFDEDFGPGSAIGAGEDTDYIYRAYIAGATLEYVPDMTAVHHHGRKTADEGKELFRGYMVAAGALYVRYLFRHPNLCRPFYWDCKSAIREVITGTNTFLPNISFSHRDCVACCLLGAARYVFLRKSHTPDSVTCQTGPDFADHAGLPFA
jgi:glycosyltransferase involved in cell wall biosynthesis